MHSHKSKTKKLRYRHDGVLILVVMEDALAQIWKWLKQTQEIVLILVVMEDALALWERLLPYG